MHDRSVKCKVANRPLVVNALYHVPAQKIDPISPWTGPRHEFDRLVRHRSRQARQGRADASRPYPPDGGADLPGWTRPAIRRLAGPGAAAAAIRPAAARPLPRPPRRSDEPADTARVDARRSSRAQGTRSVGPVAASRRRARPETDANGVGPRDLPSKPAPRLQEQPSNRSQRKSIGGSGHESWSRRTDEAP